MQSNVSASLYFGDRRAGVDNEGNETLDAKGCRSVNVKIFISLIKDDQMLCVGKDMRQKNIISNDWINNVEFVPKYSFVR